MRMSARTAKMWRPLPTTTSLPCSSSSSSSSSPCFRVDHHEKNDGDGIENNNNNNNARRKQQQQKSESSGVSLRNNNDDDDDDDEGVSCSTISNDEDNDLNGTIEYLGTNRDTGMVLIHPPPSPPTSDATRTANDDNNDEENDVVGLLHKLDTLLRKRSTRLELDKLINDPPPPSSTSCDSDLHDDNNSDNHNSSSHDDSVRRIQGGRYELFVSADTKSSLAFDTITSKGNLPPNAKQKVLDYAKERALLDPRLQKQQQRQKSSLDENNNEEKYYEFGNFSLIVSYDEVPAQSPHIDLLYPNYQFGLMITDMCAGTTFYDDEGTAARGEKMLSSKRRRRRQGGGGREKGWISSGGGGDGSSSDNIQSPEDVSDLWTEMSGHPTPQSILTWMKRDTQVQSLLRGYGPVLTIKPQSINTQMIGPPHPISCGTVQSLPGSIIHAGPSSSTFRAVLFYSAWPHGSRAARYDPDTQYSAVLLCIQLVGMAWRYDGIGYEERKFLLDRVVQYVLDGDAVDVWHHLDNSDFSAFIERIETRYKSPNDVTRREEFVKRTARNEALCDSWVSFESSSCGGGVGGTINLSEWEVVSVDGELETWDEETERWWDVKVYRKRRRRQRGQGRRGSNGGGQDVNGKNNNDGGGGSRGERVILWYPNNNNNETTTTAGGGCCLWEGAAEGDCYRLHMATSLHAKNNEEEGAPVMALLFDGTNGTVVDTEGKKIEFRPKLLKRKSVPKEDTATSSLSSLGEEGQQELPME